MIKHIIYLLIMVSLISSCYKEQVVIVERPEGWEFDTHSNLASVDYTTVFNQNQVNQLYITITSDDWDTMQDDLESLYGSSGGPGGGPGQGGGGGGGTTFADEKPVTVPCQIYHDGIQWFDVGIRYKGNSSLSSAYSSGKGKLPLRLDFDYFEDENELITNQRFYGFKELSLSSNYLDDSFLHEKVASDMFRAFNVPSAQTAFYEIYVDNGDGNGYVYFGLYTLVEVVFDTMLESQFGANSGNCYKPDGDAATFSDGTFDTDELEKKTNETTGDWSDLESLYEVINSSDRVNNTEQWKTNLEAIFNVDGYLRYLAANTVMQNWDTYGIMTHNYFLYNNPADGKINWIPWDNNESLNNDKNNCLDFDFASLNASEWPLIGYIYDIPEYKTIYDNYIDEFIEGDFKPINASTTYSNWHNMISNSVAAESGIYTYINNYSDFTNSLSTLNSHTSQRYNAASSYTP